jgi:hypothetical protein
MALELLKSSLREIGISTIVLSPDHDAPLECVPSAPVTQEGKKSRFGEDLPPTRVAAWGLIEKGVLWHAVTRRQ